MPQKRILTMQDLSCVGRCSLTVALPVLSAYGIETCVLPTAILSNHTAFPRWSCLDLSEEAGRIMAAWRENGFRFDGFLTGYLGSPAAIDVARACFQGFSREGAPIVIDPAFGDYGRLYPAFDRSYVAAMGELIRSAHILLPNFTEVCFLSGTEYQSAAPPAYMKEAVVRLSRMTPAAIVMTGAESGGQTGELIYAGGEFTEVWTPLLPGRFHGTGDLFAAAFTAAYLQSGDLAGACGEANLLVSESIAATGDPRGCGVNFECALANLRNRPGETPAEHPSPSAR